MTTGPVPANLDALGLWGRPITLISLVMGWLVLTVIFGNLPGLDIAVSRFFFTEQACGAASHAQTCGIFALGNNPALRAVREFMHPLPAILAIIVAAYGGWQAWRQRSLADPRVRIKSVLMWTMIVGPLLFVNVFLKQTWGRPRPVQTDLFGGDVPFVAAGIKTDYCAANCSFVSGEASSAFWLVCLAFAAPRRYRTAAVAAAAIVAVPASSLRIAFGGHYLSDVVLGAFSTLVVFALVSNIDTWLFRHARGRLTLLR